MREQDKTINIHIITSTPLWLVVMRTPHPPHRRGLGGYMAAGVCPDWTDIDCVGPLLMHAAIVLAGVGREAVQYNLLVVVPYYKADIYFADNDASVS